jgi:hypothetical protein
MKKIALAFALLGAALTAQAHRPWMIPNTSFIESEREAWVQIDGAVSEGLFEFDHLPLRLDGLSVTGPDGASTPAPAAAVGKFRSTVDIRLPKDGTYRLTLAAVNVMGSYKLNGEPKRFRATEQTVAKEIPVGASEVRTTTVQQRQDTFVTLNKPSMGALQATGAGLEMVALTNPTELHTGEKARFRFQLDGKPLPNFPFSLIPGGARYRGTIGEVRLSTDAKGEASFTLPAPSMYLLTAAYPADAPRGPGAEGPTKRYSYSATFEILPE